MNPVLPRINHETYSISIESFITLLSDWQDNLNLLKKYLTKSLSKVNNTSKKLAIVCAIRLIKKNKKAIPYLIEHKELLIKNHPEGLIDLLLHLKINDNPLMDIDDLVRFLLPKTSQKPYALASMRVCLDFFFYESTEQLKGFLNYNNKIIILPILEQCERNDYDFGILDKIEKLILESPNNTETTEYINILLSWLSDAQHQNNINKIRIINIGINLIPTFLNSSKKSNLDELFFHSNSIRKLLTISTYHPDFSLKIKIYDEIIQDTELHIEIRMMVLSIFCTPYYTANNRKEIITEFFDTIQRSKTTFNFHDIYYNYLLNNEYPITQLLTLDEILLTFKFNLLGLPYSLLSRWPIENKPVIFNYLLKNIKKELRIGADKTNFSNKQQNIFIDFKLIETSIHILTYSFLITKKEQIIIARLLKKWLFNNKNHQNFTYIAYRITCCLLTLGIIKKSFINYIQDDWRKIAILWPAEKIKWDNILLDLIDAEVINYIDGSKVKELKKKCTNGYYLNDWLFFKSILIESNNFDGIYRIRKRDTHSLHDFSETLKSLFNITIDWLYYDSESTEIISLEHTDQSSKKDNAFFFEYKNKIYGFSFIEYEHDSSIILSTAEYINIFLTYIDHPKRLYVFEHYDPMWENNYDAFYELYFFSAIPNKLDPLIKKLNLPVQMPSATMRANLVKKLRPPKRP